MVIWVFISCALACTMPSLPPSLSYLSPSFQYTGQLNAFGSYLASDVSYQLDLQQDSWFRLAIEPQNHATEIKVLKENEVLLADKAEHNGVAKVFGKLAAGIYVLELSIEGVSEADNSNTVLCQMPNLFMNLGILPTDHLSSYTSQAESQNFPDISGLLPAFNSTLILSETYGPFAVPYKSLTKKTVYEFPIKVPKLPEEFKNYGLNGLWQVTFSLHHHFIVSGGLGIMLNKGEKVRSKKKCAEDGGCIFGKRDQMNTITLNTILTEGNFVISVFYDLSESEKELLEEIGKIDLSLRVGIEGLSAKEDRFNCEAARLPDSLDFLLDLDGFLRYSDWIFADFGKKKQATVFKLNKPSVFRMVTVEPAGVDVDLTLYTKGNAIAKSNAVGGSEGILIELEIGTYALDISFVNSFIEDSRKKFCETVLVEIGISPQDAVREYNRNFDLNSCQDTTEDLLKWFESVKDNISKEKVQLNTANTFYTLPIPNLAESEQRLFSVSFTVPKIVYGYFEVFSDFVTSSLSINLSKSSDPGSSVLKGSDNALNLGEHSRRTFALTLKPGTYTFNILSSASAKLLNSDGDTYRPYNSPSDYKQIQPCVAFQLRIQLIPTSSKAMNSWECKDTDFKLLPKTLNTLDKLGIKDTPANIMPAATYFSQAVAAPNSFNNVTDSSLFYIESESVIRVLVESEDSPMIISLFKGDDLVAESKDQKNFIYGISTVLDQHSSYRLQVSYFPASKKCHTYAIALEIVLKSRIGEDKKKECAEVPIGDSFVNERLLQIGGIFEFILDDGVSSVNLEPEVVYKQRKKAYEGVLNFEITAESALITGHLLLNFAKTNLIMEIFSEEGELIEWGSYKSLSRYELDPIPLTQGKYQLRVRELVPSPVLSCTSYKGSVLMEDIAFWNDVSSMIKTIQACNFPDVPDDLGLVGMMMNNTLEWSQNLPIDSYLGQTILEFSVTDSVVFSVSVGPVRNTKFDLRISKFLDTEVYYEGGNTLSGILEKGTYLLEILYESDFGLPSPSLCQTFPISLSLLPSSQYSSRQSKSCKKSQSLPQSLQSNFDRSFEIFGELNSQIKVQVSESSQLDFFASFDFIQSGSVHMELLDNNKKLLKLSSSQYGYAQLSLSVPSGDYILNIWSEKSYKKSCWDLNFSFSHTFSEVCLGALLPENLSGSDSLPFGGPQGPDGSISFSGRFAIDKDSPEQILQFNGKGDSIVRVLTVTRGKFRTESGVYQTNLFNSPIGYSKNKSKYSSYIFQIQAQDTPYYLVLNHIIEENRGCMLYDLKIVVRPISSVSEQLKCKLASHEETLPPAVIELSKAWSFDNENLAIFDKWIIGNKLPEGVISNGKKNSKFLFSSGLSVSKAGYLTAEVVYDYLTNDLAIEIWNEESLLASSNWDNIVDDQFMELSKISSLLDEVYLLPGNYKMILTQGLVANHLIQKFPEQSSCFPFELFMEFTPKVISKNNKLMSVVPPEHNSHNTLQNLILILKFSKPIKEQTSKFQLKSPISTLSPNEVSIDSDSSSRVRLKFLSTSLIPGTCYDLIIEGENLDSDGLLHQYCTSPCKCNPVSEAQCIDNSCVCASPYTGIDCFECEDGHLMEKNTCINVVDENPKVLSVKLNVQSNLKKNQQLRVYVNLSSAPFNKEGEKISRTSSQALIDSFYLKLGTQSIKAFNAMPLVKGNIRWVLRFSTEEMSYGATYDLEQVSGLIFTSSGQPFSFYNLPPLKVTVSDKPEDLAVCSGHGVEINSICKCDKSYKGEDCEVCDIGYYRTASGTCEELQEDLEVDQSAQIVQITPSKLTNLIQSENIFVTIELNQAAYTDEGLLIDGLSNSEFIQQAFVLQKGASESFVLARTVKSLDKSAKKWSLEFSSKSLEPGKMYKLLQLDNALFTQKKKVFAKTEIDMPRFRAFASIECGFGKQEMNSCVCLQGYSGSTCQNCDNGYIKNLVGECIVETRTTLSKDPSPFSIWSTLLYCLGYFALGMIVIYLVGHLRKPQDFQADIELSHKKKEDSGEIDLYR